MKRSLLLLVGAVAIVGCGSGGAPKLSNSDELKLAEINVAFSYTVLDGSHYGETLRGTDELIELCRHHRDALYEPSKHRFETVKQVMEDDANTLRPYQHDLAAKLDAAAAANCT